MSSTKRKQIKVKAVAPKLKLFRANEPLLSVFMWGVNHTVNELSHVNMRLMLMPDDFKSYSKIRVDNHMFNKDNMPSRFKVKEYCPIVFKNLRERFGIDDLDYLSSLTKQQPIACDSPGRSGARMLMSRDKKFFIKTLVSEEVEMMHHVLKQYHQHVVESHAHTLLPQYLAMYRLTVNDVETYLVVMRNVFSPRLSIHKKYDLKGSTVDRSASEKERADYHYEDDQDGFGSPPDSPQPITPMPQFMGELDPDLERYGLHSSEESGKHELYFMALIDILTKYGMKKRTAQAAKTVKHGAGAEISTVHHEQYAKRFMEFISKCFE
ncbi:phosphatidylinositol 5-phosphate 4-kinase type-2 alpha [Plakobranchus ocellatus]|uniref:1-phosphatidylinositol-5-phosphate 4-kinase n=1 Tax=Plakobranchus ocellatus TaxID=259542 RepID=A0AAV4C1C8_9GAST|nr:phosphatidylinositol 5-phosphate 4-kinase type-2 alpha [Plakobranchus ocellatus]